MERPLFALTIRPVGRNDGKYELETFNSDIPDEIVLTQLRHWLKLAETSYHHKFRKVA